MYVQLIQSSSNKVQFELPSINYGITYYVSFLSGSCNQCFEIYVAPIVKDYKCDLIGCLWSFDSKAYTL